MATLCGAPSWLSKAIWKALSALTVTAVWVNFRSTATMLTASPDGLPAGAWDEAGRCAGTGGQHGGQRERGRG